MTWKHTYTYFFLISLSLYNLKWSRNFAHLVSPWEPTDSDSTFKTSSLSFQNSLSPWKIKQVFFNWRHLGSHCKRLIPVTLSKQRVNNWRNLRERRVTFCNLTTAYNIPGCIQFQDSCHLIPKETPSIVISLCNTNQEASSPEMRLFEPF